MDGGRLVWVGKGWSTLGATGSGWARGYAFIGDGGYLEDHEIARYLLEHSSRLETTVAAMNGCFAAAIDTHSGPVLITDRYGTIPIYIHRAGERVHASDEPWKVIETLEAPPVLDDLSSLDILRTGYVTGMATLIRSIETVAPASVVAIRGGELHRSRYWDYGYRPEPLAWDEAQDRLVEVLRRVANRAMRGIESRGYTCGLTLSGGLDSRVLASTLSATASGPLSAFSYGMRGDPEIDVAKQVACHLRMPHHEALLTPSYFNDDFVGRSVEEVGLTTRFTCGIGARHLGHRLTDVMIPGHTGDFISGGHLPAQSGLVRTRDQLRRYLELTHFRYRGSERVLRRILCIDYRHHKWKTLESTTEDFDMSSDSLGLVDRWNVENRQRRLILMELRAYEELGRWMLPFYDHELVDFFAVIPHEFRIAQNLYIQTAKTRLFANVEKGLADLQRVGSKPMVIDASLPSRISQLQQLQPFSGWVLQLGLAELRDLVRAIRPKPEQTFGTDPVKRWFKSNERVRNYVLDRVESMNVDLVDASALKALLLEGSAEERVYNRLLPAALTIQACFDRAREVWRSGRRLSGGS